MANIFIDGDEIANQKDLNRLLGQNDYVSDSLDNHISETGIYPTKQTNGGILSSLLSHLKQRIEVVA